VLHTPLPQEAGKKTAFSQEFNHRCLQVEVGATQRKTLFEGCGASRHTPQTAIIELTSCYIEKFNN
jgi:hypothetical protein